MKNRINILAEGKWVLPIGARVKNIGVANDATSEYVVRNENYVVRISNYMTFVNQVDFSELPPLYPTPGMIVPEEGIEFSDGDGKIIDVSKVGITYVNGKGELFHNYWSQFDPKSGPDIYDAFIIDRVLPKTIEVCADCFKELCECMHVEGWYRVRMESGWDLKYYNSSAFTPFRMSSYLTDCKILEVDWDNMINVNPEDLTDKQKEQ
jgi:hypothetical protein